VRRQQARYEGVSNGLPGEPRHVKGCCWSGTRDLQKRWMWMVFFCDLGPSWCLWRKCWRSDLGWIDTYSRWHHLLGPVKRSSVLQGCGVLGRRGFGILPAFGFSSATE
jgi:hypothetical protein